MSRISDLRQRAADVAAKMKALVEKAEGEGRDLTETEQREWDGLKTERAGLDARIARAVELRDQEAGELERRGGGGNGGDGSERDWQRTLAGYSLHRAIASQMPGASAHVDAARELEVATELRSRSPGRKFRGVPVPSDIFRVPADVGLPLLETRAPNSTFRTDGAGAPLVREQYRPDLYVDLLRANLVTAALGVRVLEDIQGAGSVVIPKQLTGANAGWVGEDEDVPEAAATWGGITLTPHTLGCWASLSRRMILTSNPAIEGLVRADLAAAVAEGIDAAFLNGNPAADAPEGLLRKDAGDGVNVVSFGPDGGPVSWAKILAMMSAPRRKNVASSRLGWLGSSRISEAAMQTLRVTGDASGGFVMEVGADGQMRLAGRPYMETELPAMLNHTEGASSDLAALVFGDFSEAIIAFWTGALDLIVDPYTLSTAGAVRITVLRDVDIAFRRLEAFAIGLVDVTA